MEVQRRTYVPVVGVSGLALDRENRNTPIRHQRSSYVILRGKGIRSDQNSFGSAGLQRAREVCCLGGYVGAGYKLDPLQRLIGGESLSN